MRKLIESYKKDEINIFELVYQMDKYEGCADESKKSGVIYTPHYISDYIVNLVSYSPEYTVIEPSVGHGVFIFSLIEHVKNKFELQGPDLKHWFENKVYAIELSKSKVDDFIEILTIYFEKNNISDVNYSKIFCGDSLFFNFDMKFDYIIGNPPYIRTKNLDSEYLISLRQNFESCRIGNVDIYYAFIERFSKICNKKMSFITPNSYLTNVHARNLREFVFSENATHIIDFREKLIFENARTYTSIFLLNFENECNNLRYKTELDKEWADLPKTSLSIEGWNFSNEVNIDEIDFSLSKDKVKVYAGIATLRDKIYVVEDSSISLINNREYYKKEYNGTEYYIEVDSCIDFYKITKNKETKIIYPYDSKTKKVLSEEFIYSELPELYKYLLAVREELDKRDKGKTEKYEAWYAYGRKQGLDINYENNNIFIPIMISNKVSYKITENEPFLFSSGFIISSSDKEILDDILECLSNILFFDYIKSVGKPWPGSNEYYTITTKILNKFLKIKKK